MLFAYFLWLRCPNVCKLDLKLTDIDPDSWELPADIRWHHAVREGVKRREGKRNQQLEDRRPRRKQRQQKPSIYTSIFFLQKVQKRPLLNHSRQCSQHDWSWPTRSLSLSHEVNKRLLLSLHSNSNKWVTLNLSISLGRVLKVSWPDPLAKIWANEYFGRLLSQADKISALWRYRILHEYDTGYISWRLIKSEVY